MSRITNRLETAERAVSRRDPMRTAWRICIKASGETSEQAIERHNAQYGRGPKVIVPAKVESEDPE